MRHAAPRSLPLSFIEEASAPEVAELIVEAYALTERERAVTALVCQGCSTRQIAGRLFTSEHTRPGPPESAETPFSRSSHLIWPLSAILSAVPHSIWPVMAVLSVVSHQRGPLLVVRR